MKYLALQILLISIFFAQSKTEEIKKISNGFEKTIQINLDKISSIEDFRLEASIGEIEIIKSDKKYPYIISKIYLRLNDKNEANEIFNEFKTDVEERSNRVIVYFQDRLNHRNNYGNRRYFHVSHQIYINPNIKLDVKTSGGSISGEDLNNQIKGKTSGGNIKFRSIVGAIDINTSGGNIVMEKVSGDIEANTSGGNITMIDVTGKLDVRTSGGSITLERISSEIEAKTSGGDIDVNDLSEHADLKTSGGNIRFKKIKNGLVAKTSGGNIRGEDVSGFTVVETSGGDIYLRNIKGAIEAENGSGDIEISLNLENYDGSKGSYISTNNGNVIVEISQSSSFEAQLSSRSFYQDDRNRIRSDYKLDHQGKRSIAKNKDGKHKIYIETNGGKIRLNKE